MTPDKLEEIREPLEICIQKEWSYTLSPDQARTLLSEIDRLREELEEIRRVASKRKSDGMEQLAWDPYHALATRALAESEGEG